MKAAPRFHGPAPATCEVCRDKARQFHLVELASLEIRLSRSENLPVLPQAVSSVLRLADDPTTSPRQIAQCIERDPAITAKVLRAANSAYYGFRNVNTLGKAISFLGLNSIRSLVVSVALQNMLAGRSLATSFNKTEYWRHCLAVATGCRILGTMRFPMKIEELFCAGMLHDVGMLVFDKFLASEFEEAIRHSRHLGIQLERVERQTIGFDHCEVGGLLADKWGLPKLMRHAIVYHNDPDLDGDYYETTCIVNAANALAHRCGFHNNLPNVSYEIPERVLESVGLPVEQFDSIGKVVVLEVERAQAMFKVR